MKEINLEELKEIQISILDRVHDFCVENGITYFLACGSLLGAIRHGGYIPWDDDIDLFMPREDYERFINTYNKVQNGTRVKTIFSDEKYYYSFAKVEDITTLLIEDFPEKMDIGVNIDIFPVDGVPNNKLLRKWVFFKNKTIRKLSSSRTIKSKKEGRSALKHLLVQLFIFMFRGFTMRDFAVWLDSSINKSNNNSQFVCNLTAGKIGRCMKRSVILDSTDIIFEGKSYKTMIGYDEYLTMTYGNYMQLPPLEMQKSHHVFQAFYRE